MKCRNEKKDCFANISGECKILIDTKFVDKRGKRRQCPFYKYCSPEEKEKLNKTYLIQEIL